jgi:carboxymethylenebutenolidase
VTLIDYPGVDHGFATEMGDRRNDIAAEQADRNSAEFFATHLG